MRLHLDGTLPRLAAPGVPDWIGADGDTIGWALRDRLFLLRGGAVDVVPLPDDVEDVCAAAGTWTVAHAIGFVRVDVAEAQPVAVLLEDEHDPVTTRPGRDLGLFVEVPEHRLLRLADGRPLPLPDAALRARHIRPWETGIGACWVDFETLYRMGARVSALGRAPNAEALRCGPEGAAIVTLKGDTVVAAPKGLAARVGQRLDADTARFSPDGGKVLAASERGVVLVDTRDGSVARVWEGNLAPVGFTSGGPVLLDLDRGALVDADRNVILGGFAASVPAFAGERLAGPGGALWDLASGERLRDDLREGACATDGERVAHVTDTEVRLLGGATFAHSLCADDDEVASARFDGEALVVQTVDGESATFGPDGALRAKKRHTTRPHRHAPEGVTLPDRDGESWVEVGGERYPVPADGAARVGGRVWVWTDDGMLAVLPG